MTHPTQSPTEPTEDDQLTEAIAQAAELAAAKANYTGAMTTALAAMIELHRGGTHPEAADTFAEALQQASHAAAQLAESPDHPQPSQRPTNQHARKHGAFSTVNPTDPGELAEQLSRDADAAITRGDSEGVRKLARGMKLIDADEAEILRNISRRLEQLPAIRTGRSIPIRRFSMDIEDVDAAINRARQRHLTGGDPIS